MYDEVTVKKMKSGNFGVFIENVLVSVAKTEGRANSVRIEIIGALKDAYDEGVGDGYDEGLEEGSNGD
jgi:flagellar biosynthesis/type III secretory pathway protein FliH